MVRPDFNIYEALELTTSASQDEINKAYKRLALLHHPDKNLDNPEATARFQQISTAYQILKDPNTRQRYDRTSNSPDSSHEWDDEPDEAFGMGGFMFMFGGMFAAAFENAQRREASGSSQGRGYRREAPDFFHVPGDFNRFENDWQGQAATERAERAAEAAERTAARHAQQDKERAAKLAEKVAREKKEVAEVEAKTKQETKKFEGQQARWKVAKAVTQAEKQGICEHVEFWPKEQQKRKFKCGECGQKRGMMAFKCPWCMKLVCQVCIREITAKESDS